MSFTASIASLLRFDVEGALSDPIQVGALLDLGAILKDLEPRLQETAITMGLQGVEIPGWSVVRKGGSRYIEASYVRDLLLECHAQRLQGLLEAVSKALGNVSESRWQSLCEAAGKEGEGAAVSQAGAKAFLRRAQENQNHQP
jgi:hypothetical protein